MIHPFKGHVVPFFLLLFLSFAAVIIGDNTAESLLLASYDAKIIAKLFSLNALFLFLFSLSMLSLIDRINRGKLFTRFLLTHSLILLTSWVLLQWNVQWIVIPLFSYAYVSKIFTFLIFWTLANDIVDSRKAARDFPLIAAGGTMGAIGISFVIPQIVSAIPAEYLLLIWAVLNGVVILLFKPIKKQFGRSFLPTTVQTKEKNKLTQIKNDILTISHDPLLKSMAFFYFLLFFVLLNQQFGFYEVLHQRFQEASEFSAFLGYFNGISMVLTFLLQMTLSSFVIRKIGSTRSMFILPIVFTVVFIFLGLTPLIQKLFPQAELITLLFWGTVLGLGLRIAVFDSFYSPNFQIFFSSLPRTIRGRGKIALEGVVKPFAMLLASLWLTLILPKLPSFMATLIMVLSSGMMIYLTLRMRKQYTSSLTKYLSEFKDKSGSEIEKSLNSDDIVTEIAALIEVESYDVQCYLIEILGDIDSEAARTHLVSLLSNREAPYLARLIKSLAPKAIPKASYTYATFLDHEDIWVVKAAMQALSEYKSGKVLLLPFLQSKQLELRLTVIELLWWDVNNNIQDKMLDEIIKGLASSNREHFFRTLDLCGRIDVPEITQMIPQRFEHFSDPLIETNYGWKRFTNALAELEGEEVLHWILSNSNSLSANKLESLIPAIQNIIKTGFTPEKVLNLMKRSTPSERFLLAKGLLGQGVSFPNMRSRIWEQVQQEFKALNTYSNHISMLSLQSNQTALLIHAIEEELLTLHRETAISLVALLDKKGEIKRISNRLTSEVDEIRSRALEVLDNVGDMRLNKKLLPYLSKPQPTAAKKADIENTIQFYIESKNSWLEECALFSLKNVQSGVAQ